jgi:glycogen operon protein
MITMGDEIRRTQLGNNNAYCQDNETSWFDWSLVAKYTDVHRFLKLLIKRRLSRHLENEHEGEPLNQLLRESSKAWHGVKLHQPDWSASSHSVALSAEIVDEGHCVHWILNAYREPLDFELPKVGGPWRRWIDTVQDSPEDIVEWQNAPPLAGHSYKVGPHSVAVLYAPVSTSSDAQ